jgi:hypothetical protein
MVPQAREQRAKLKTLLCHLIPHLGDHLNFELSLNFTGSELDLVDLGEVVVANPYLPWCDSR